MRFGLSLEVMIYRILSFFDKDDLIVLGNGFVKKSRKTPTNEIYKVLKIREEYFYDKE